MLERGEEEVQIYLGLPLESNIFIILRLIEIYDIKKVKKKNYSVWLNI